MSKHTKHSDKSRVIVRSVGWKYGNCVLEYQVLELLKHYGAHSCGVSENAKDAAGYAWWEMNPGTADRALRSALQRLLLSNGTRAIYLPSDLRWSDLSALRQHLETKDP